MCSFTRKSLFTSEVIYDHREKATTVCVRELIWFETGMRSKDV